MTLSEQQRLYQHALEHARRVRDDTLDDEHHDVKDAHAEVKRARG